MAHGSNSAPACFYKQFNWNIATPHLFTYDLWLHCVLEAKLSIWNRDWRAYKAENIYCLAFVEKVC